jgi:anaerobic magnesium-protoporphyrin IX monomethyl ester cyclase
MKIRLIYPPFSGSWKTHFLGLPYIAAYARESYPDIQIIDAAHNGMSIEAVKQQLLKERPDVVGVSIPFAHLERSGLSLLTFCRENGLFCVSGGAYCTLYPERPVDCSDIVVMGDGEEAFKEVLDAFNSDRNYRAIKGLLFKEGPETVSTGQREYEKNLDDLPYPARDLLPLDLCTAVEAGVRSFPIITSRGCPYTCTFCANWKLSRRLVRNHSVDYTINEIRHYIEDFDIKHFQFRDEVFALNESRVEQVCRRILDERLNIRWTCQTRADLASDKLFRLMRQSGCERLSFGIETANPDIMKKLNKRIDLDKVAENIHTAKKNGLKVYCGFMVGLPWDTPETIEETVRWVSRVNPEYVGFQIFTPFPRTEIYQDALKHGELLTDDFESYTTGGTVYVPAGLKKHGMVDMVKLRDQMYRMYRYRRPIRRMMLPFVRKKAGSLAGRFSKRS